MCDTLWEKTAIEIEPTANWKDMFESLFIQKLELLGTFLAPPCSQWALFQWAEDKSPLLGSVAKTELS